ncbi:MAG: hypothetical protein WA947_19160 [Phormidesmis sp.]
MNKLHKTKVTSLALAASCAFSGIAVEAEAREIDLSMIGLDGRAVGMGLDTTSHQVPSVGALGLVAAAPTAEMAKTARLPHSSLVPRFSNNANNAKTSYQTQTAMLPVVAPLSGRQLPMVVPAGSSISRNSSSEAINGRAINNRAINNRGLPALDSAIARLSDQALSELSSTVVPVVEQSDLPQFYPSRQATAALKTETSTLPAASSEPSLEIAQGVPSPSDTFAPLSDEEIRQQLLINPNQVDPNIDVLDRNPLPIPSSTFITPNAYGASWGDAYIGVAGTTEDTDDGLDGSVGVGVGFGNPIDNVGVEVSVGIISLDGFADDGIAGFKVHKVFPQANNLAVAVGWANPIKWGAAGNEEDTFYGVATQRFNLRPSKANPLPLTASLGVGTGEFRSNGAIAAGDNSPNVFGSVGLRVIPQVSLISSWTGSGLGLAASAAPFRAPLVLTLGASDVTGNTEQGAQFSGSLGYSFNFR